MRFSIALYIFLAAANSAFAIEHPDNSTAAFRILSFLHQLELSVLDKLATQTNDTIFRQASEVSRIS